MPQAESQAGAPSSLTDAQASQVRKTHIPGEEGVWVFILGEMTVFAVFFVVFAYYRNQAPELFTASQAALNVGFGLTNTLLLLTSSWSVAMAITAARRRSNRTAGFLLGSAFLCGAGFSLIKLLEYSQEIEAGHTLTSNDFFAYYYILTGLHFIHVIVGMVILVVMTRHLLRAAKGGADLRFLEGGASYWHMVDLLWIILFPLIYLIR